MAVTLEEYGDEIMRRIVLLALILIPLLFYNAPHVSVAAKAFRIHWTIVRPPGLTPLAANLLVAGNSSLIYVSNCFSSEPGVIRTARRELDGF
jgi:hypothetical protein